MGYPEIGGQLTSAQAMGGLERFYVREGQGPQVTFSRALSGSWGRKGLRE